jgi:hypothetical protein
MKIPRLIIKTWLRGWIECPLERKTSQQQWARGCFSAERWKIHGGKGCFELKISRRRLCLAVSLICTLSRVLRFVIARMKDYG